MSAYSYIQCIHMETYGDYIDAQREQSRSRVKFRAADIERLIDAVRWRQNFSRDQMHSRTTEQHAFCTLCFSGLRLRLHKA